jgi:hypothetical protein
MGLEEIKAVCLDPQRLAAGIDTDKAAKEVIGKVQARILRGDY